MSPLDADLIRRKLAVITRNLQDLARVGELSVEAYRSDRFLQKGTERMLQEVIEAAVDTNLHILRERGTPTPPDYYESFVEMGRQAVIPPDLAAELAPAAGLRNRLVHEYDRIDDTIVLAAVREAEHAFRAYIAAVEGFVESSIGGTE